MEGMIKKKIASLRVDGLAKPSKSDQVDRGERKSKVRKERSSTGGSSRHDTVPELDENAYAIEMDDIVTNSTDEAVVTDAMVDHLAASTPGTHSPPPILTHTNGSTHSSSHIKHDSLGSVHSIGGSFPPRKPVDDVSLASTPPDSTREVTESLSARKQFFRHMDSSAENLSPGGDTNNI